MSAGSGDARREKIMGALSGSESPLSGAALAERCGVSRQVVVTDIALLRTRGEKIVSTNRGYVLIADGAPPACSSAATPRSRPSTSSPASWTWAGAWRTSS